MKQVPDTTMRKAEIDIQLTQEFLQIRQGIELCKWLRMQFRNLECLINHPEYVIHDFRKKRGGVRRVFAPNADLMRVQRKLNRVLQHLYSSCKSECVHGFTKMNVGSKTSTNIVANAQVHVGKRAVLNLDLVDFFPSIPARKVKEVFLAEPFGFSEDIAVALALLTTYRGFIPQGAPTSPVLSNFVCRGLDAALLEWSQKNGANYTRYADDLTFSGDAMFTLEQLLEIREIILGKGFRVNEKKSRQRLQGKRQTVTGLTVNEKVNVDRRYIKRVRAMLHDLQRSGVKQAANKHFQGQQVVCKEGYFLERLAGSISFIGQVRGKEDFLFQRMQTTFQPIYKELKKDPSIMVRRFSNVPDSVLFHFADKRIDRPTNG